jgi:hypothetical protein
VFGVPIGSGSAFSFSGVLDALERTTKSRSRRRTTISGVSLETLRSFDGRKQRREVRDGQRSKIAILRRHFARSTFVSATVPTSRRPG